MFDFIKEIHRKKVIRDLKATPREKKIDNIDEVKSIGVICRLSDEQNWNILHHFAKVMENQGKTVAFIALLEREQDINFVITHQGTHIVRTKSDFNFWACRATNPSTPSSTSTTTCSSTPSARKTSSPNMWLCAPTPTSRSPMPLPWKTQRKPSTSSSAATVRSNSKASSTTSLNTLA